MFQRSQFPEPPESLTFHDPEVLIHCDPQVYRPAEDSFLLLHSARQLLEEGWPGRGSRATGELSVLELGTGTGMVGISLLRLGVEKLVLTDVNPHALACARKNLEENKRCAELLNCSLFCGIKSDFDLILFNPPYLPEEPKEPKDHLTRALSGGPQGAEIAREFLKRLPAHLREGGAALLILSSLNPVEELLASWKGETRLMGQESFFFEKLFCYAFFR